MVARTALMLGSAQAAIRSAARSRGDAARRVVGNSTGIRPRSSRSRRIASSCTAGKTAGAANDGDTTATRSPTTNLGYGVKAGSSVIELGPLDLVRRPVQVARQRSRRQQMVQQQDGVPGHRVGLRRRLPL